MLRIVLGVIAGFIAWVIAWIGSEKILAVIWPEGFGVHQRAFEEAVKNGGEFTADTAMLLTHIVLGSIVSLMAGSLATLIAGENTRAPLALGFVLVALGILKTVMSWQYAPLWYHAIFTAVLLPLAVVGGKLITTT
jgi:hypothetical protein